MCARFAVVSSGTVYEVHFNVEGFPFEGPVYNFAPSCPTAIVRRNIDSKQKEWGLTSWGLIPQWAKDPSIGMKLFNARAETLLEKPSFRTSFRHKRCLIPVDWFYEWKTENGVKQPYAFMMKDRQPFALAGLWEYWAADDGSDIETCCVITTEPNDTVKSIHNRMPVIIAKQDYDEWITLEALPKDLFHLLKPFRTDKMTSVPVTPLINNSRYQGVVSI